MFGRDRDGKNARVLAADIGVRHRRERHDRRGERAWRKVEPQRWVRQRRSGGHHGNQQCADANGDPFAPD